MQALEKKVPPPLVGLLVAGLMWSLAAWPPAILLPPVVRLPIAAALAFVGVGFDILAIVAFRRFRTTVNPLRPERASALVTGGIYRITRNPMYVGLALLLTAWAVYLSALWPFVGPLVFVAYINRFQIAPEERILETKFSEFRAYAARVRRWL